MVINLIKRSFISRAFAVALLRIHRTHNEYQCEQMRQNNILCKLYCTASATIQRNSRFVCLFVEKRALFTHLHFQKRCAKQIPTNANWFKILLSIDRFLNKKRIEKCFDVRKQHMRHQSIWEKMQTNSFEMKPIESVQKKDLKEEGNSSKQRRHKFLYCVWWPESSITTEHQNPTRPE